MSVQHIIDAALNKARASAGGTKTAAAPGGDLVKLAHELADANEFIAMSAVDDGSVAGAVRRSVVEQFFKGADTSAIPGPARSVAPTGTQAVPPQSGSKKILPTGHPCGESPPESEAPTGTQATLDQTGTKKAGAPMTLFDLITKRADTSAIPGPQQSVSGENAAAPPARNENTNIEMLRSVQDIVNATKREAKLPTRARLAQLFAHADDTGASRAAAEAAFPMATAKGGLKVADAGDPPKHDWFGGEAQMSRGNTQIRAARESLGMSAPEREDLLRQGLQNRAEGSDRARRGNTALGSLVGAYPGAAVGALLGFQHGIARGAALEAARRAGLSGAAAGALTGGVLLGGTTYGLSKLRARLAREEAADPSALHADVASHLYNKRHMRQEHAALADLVAAREGRRAAGSGMFNVNINKGGSPYNVDTKRSPFLQEEKRASLADYAALADLAAAGQLGEDALNVIRFAEELSV